MNFFNIHKQLINVIVLGFGFLFIMGAFTISMMMEQSYLYAEKQRYEGNFTGSGYLSLSITYITYSISAWFAPVVVVLLTPKYSMVLSGLTISLFIFSFLHPITWILYLGSALIGFANATIWISHGNCMSMNSNSDNVLKNTSIFWAIYQSSLIFGNIINYFVFRKTQQITLQQATLFYSIFGGCCLFGALVLLLLRNPHKEKKIILSINSETTDPNEQFNALNIFFQSFRLIKTKNMLCLILIFCYTGLELTFYSGIYGTAVGQTMRFGEFAKGYIGLIGIAIGLGEMIMCLVINILSKLKRTLFTADLLIIIALIVHLSAYFIIFISLPFNSNIEDSMQPTFIKPDSNLIIFAGFLIGLGDSIYQNLTISILADYYKGSDCPTAFAILNFFQTLTTSLSFLSSNYLNLAWQLMILCGLALAGSLSFIYAELEIRHEILVRNIKDYSEANKQHPSSNSLYSRVSNDSHVTLIY